MRADVDPVVFAQWLHSRKQPAPGDRVVVNEGWRLSKNYDDRKPAELIPRLMSVMYDGGGSMGGVDPYPKTGPRLAADFKPDRSWPPAGAFPDWAGRRRASFHMPRWASRLTLLVDDVRLERLQDISEADALAEGVVWESADPPFYYVPGIYPHSLTAVGVEERDDLPHAVRSYAKLWKLINGPESWDANPWVAVICFRVHPGNIDTLEAA